jgi:hypothetical protein
VTGPRALRALAAPALILAVGVATGWSTRDEPRPAAPAPSVTPASWVSSLTDEGLALDGTPADPLLRVPGRPTLTGLEEMLRDPDPVRAHAGYDVALWVVHDLLDRGGMPAMRTFMARLGRGDTIATAVPAVYGVPLVELEHQWRRVLGG